MITVHLFGQNIKFSPFEAVSYHIPYDNYKLGYGSHVESYDTLSSFTWPRIIVSERETDVPFPDVPKTTGFGIIFNSDIRIDTIGCYEFSINSDDGSLLFIEDSLLIDNGGNHKMTEKKDTFLIGKGNYKLKLWYQQLYPTKYGFIFKADYAGDSSTCTDQLIKTSKNLILEETFTFESGSYQLKKQDEFYLDSIINELIEYGPSEIIISGHTDDVGSIEVNERLSHMRAQAILKYLEQKIDLSTTKVETLALANSKPLIEGKSKEARAANRRVEILLK